MSPDETLVLLGCGVTTWIALHRWYAALRRVNPLRPESTGRGALRALPPLAGVVLLLVLMVGASADVRSSGLYTVFYLLMGGMWLALVLRLLPFVGYDPRGDVLERGNAAATPVVMGAGLGGVLAYAGGNIGDGPGWWVVVYCAALATGGLFLLLVCVEKLAAPAEAVTVDRDRAAGLRQGGLALAIGLVLGRAVAGDWQGIGPTCRDLADKGWPAFVIAVLAVLVQRRLTPTPDRLQGDAARHGWSPALLYVALAVAAVVHEGWPT